MKKGQKKKIYAHPRLVISSLSTIGKIILQNNLTSGTPPCLSCIDNDHLHLDLSISPPPPLLDECVIFVDTSAREGLGSFSRAARSSWWTWKTYNEFKQHKRIIIRVGAEEYIIKSTIFYRLNFWNKCDLISYKSRSLRFKSGLYNNPISVKYTISYQRHKIHNYAIDTRWSLIMQARLKICNWKANNEQKILEEHRCSSKKTESPKWLNTWIRCKFSLY